MLHTEVTLFGTLIPVANINFCPFYKGLKSKCSQIRQTQPVKFVHLNTDLKPVRCARRICFGKMYPVLYQKARETDFPIQIPRRIL